MPATCQKNVSHTHSAGREDFGLTPLERQTIALVGAGYTNKHLAQKLGITEKIAKQHLTDVFEKLGVCNRLELVLFAAAVGLTDED
jgi:DNA-binding CsgD family transcriptional regulator